MHPCVSVFSSHFDAKTSSHSHKQGRTAVQYELRSYRVKGVEVSCGLRALVRICATESLPFRPTDLSRFLPLGGGDYPGIGRRKNRPRTDIRRPHQTPYAPANTNMHLVEYIKLIRLQHGRGSSRRSADDDARCTGSKMKMKTQVS